MFSHQTINCFINQEEITASNLPGKYKLWQISPISIVLDWANLQYTMSANTAAQLFKLSCTFVLGSFGMALNIFVTAITFSKKLRVYKWFLCTHLQLVHSVDFLVFWLLPPRSLWYILCHYLGWTGIFPSAEPMCTQRCVQSEWQPYIVFAHGY